MNASIFIYVYPCYGRKILNAKIQSVQGQTVKIKKKAVVHTTVLVHDVFVSHIAHVYSHEFDMHVQLLIEARSLICGHNLDQYSIGLRVRNVG